jgi:hypothetical protein
MLSRRHTYGKRRPRGLLLLLSLAGLMFSAVPPPAVGAAELKAELVNKTWEGDRLIFFKTGQVQLSFPNGRTKHLPYRSHLEPVVADGKVYIFTSKNGILLTGIVVYDAARGQGQSFPLPKDLKLQPSFSPDGTKVAYYFLAQPGSGGARVRSWPDWRLLWESPVSELLATDVPPKPAVWKTKALVEFDPLFFDPPWFLKYQVPGPEKSE